MKSWVIRVFDPRPPWWMAVFSITSLVFFVYFTTFISLFYVFGLRSVGIKYEYFARVDHSNQELVVERTIHIEEDRFKQTVALSTLSLSTRYPTEYPNPLAFFESNDPIAIDARNAITGFRYNKVDAPDFTSDWHVDRVNEFMRNTQQQTATRFLWGKFVFWCICVALSVIFACLLIGWCVVRYRLAANLRALSAGRCPKCAYPVDREHSQTCPECGAFLDQEENRLEILLKYGYRGLIRAQAQNKAGV